MIRDYLNPEKSTEESAVPYYYSLPAILGWAEALDSNSSDEALDDLLTKDPEEVKEELRAFMTDGAKLALSAASNLISLSKYMEVTGVGVEKEEYEKLISGPGQELLEAVIKAHEDPFELALAKLAEVFGVKL